VGYWKFDEASGSTTSDSSGNGNTGTCTACPVHTSGKFGNALQFDGSDDYINTGSAPSIDNLVAFTWSAWIYPTGWGEGNIGRIIGKTTSGGFEKSVYLNNQVAPLQSIRVLLYNNASTGFYSDTAVGSIALNNWYQVVVTYDDTGDRKAHVYLNGAEASYYRQNTFSGTMYDDSANDLGIGNRGNGDRTFNGTIDDVAIWNRALSAAEVQAVYSGSFQMNCFHKSDADQNGCVDGTELTAFIDRWKVDSSDPTLKELMEAIGLWKRGC